MVETLWQQNVPREMAFIGWLCGECPFQLGPKGLLYPGGLYELWTVTEAGISRFDFRPILMERLERENIAVRHVTFIWLGEDAAFIGQNYIYVLAPPYTAVTRKIPIQEPMSWRNIENNIFIPRELNTGTLYGNGRWDIGFGHSSVKSKAFTQLHMSDDGKSARWLQTNDEDLWRSKTISPYAKRRPATSFAFQKDGFAYLHNFNSRYHLEGPDGKITRTLFSYKGEDSHMFINTHTLLISDEKFLKGKRKTRAQWIYDLKTSEQFTPILPKAYKYDAILGHADDIWYLMERTGDVNIVKAVKGIELAPFKRTGPRYQHETPRGQENNI